MTFDIERLTRILAGDATPERRRELFARAYAVGQVQEELRRGKSPLVADCRDNTTARRRVTRLLWTRWRFRNERRARVGVTA